MVEVNIRQLITKAQREEIGEYIKAQRKAKIDPMYPDYPKGLKVILKKWDQELLEKGAVSDYLAYVIIYMLSKNPELDIMKN